MAIYIHIPRTGGSAICSFFGLANSHSTALQRKLFTDPDRWKLEFKFTVVRSPWAQAVSFFSLAKRGVYSKQYPPNFREWILGGMKTHWGPPQYPPDPMDQWNYFTENDEDLVDLVVKYEELDKMLPTICHRLGWAPQRSIPQKNGSGRKWDYKPHYDRHTRHILAERYPKFCQRFGYKF